MEAHKADLKIDNVVLDDILQCDAWARQHVVEQSQKLKSASKVIIL
jgi:hypothetical protein